MAHKILKKVNSRIKFLYRKSTFLNFLTKQMLVSSLVQCHFDYACSYWFNSITKNTKSKLIRAQNKAVRFVLGKKFRDTVGVSDYK